jgi:hypothetical protein
LEGWALEGGGKILKYRNFSGTRRCAKTRREGEEETEKAKRQQLRAYRHIPQGLAGGEISVATASALNLGIKGRLKDVWCSSASLKVGRMEKQRRNKIQGENNSRLRRLIVQITKVRRLILYVHHTEKLAEEKRTTAAASAHLSAQIPTGYDAFSTFAPV